MGVFVFSLVAFVLVMVGMAVFWPNDDPSKRLRRLLHVAVDAIRAWRWPGAL